MTHWTTEVFVEQSALYRGTLEANVEMAGEDVEGLLDLLADEHGLEPETALDVACGIGRHLLPLAEAGLDVTGVDVSPDYVAAARERAREAGVDRRVDVREGDMRELDVVEGRYDLVTIFGSSFGYFDDETNRQVLSLMRERVADGGVLVMGLVNKEEWLADFEEDGVEERDDRLITRSHEYDPVESRVHTTREVFEETDDGYEHLGTMTFEARAYAPVELRERLLDAGFGAVTLYGGFDGEDIERDSGRQVVVARP